MAKPFKKFSKYIKSEVVKIARKMINPSVFQSAIFTYAEQMIENDLPNLIVGAVAGSGKTTTNIEIAYKLVENNPGIKVTMVAFNKAIATTGEAMMPVGTNAKTLHSFGLSCLGKVKVNKYKVINILQQILDIKDTNTLTNPEEIKANSFKYVQAYFGCRMISLFKNLALQPNDITIDVINKVLEFYSIEAPSTIDDEMTYIIKKAFVESNKDMFNVDFDDMIYFPALHKLCPSDMPDVLLVDEAQDLNEMQLMFLINMFEKNPNLKFIFVGDPNQAIYGFRGAGTDSMKAIKLRFKCNELPLSVSYRCGKSIIKEAQQYVPYILPFDGNADGEVISITNKEQAMAFFQQHVENASVVCRLNAPLVPLAFSLMRASLPVIIVGRDIAEGLCKLIDKVSKNVNMDIVSFANVLASWADLEYNKYVAAKKNDRAEEIRDKEATILAFTEGCTTTDDIKEKITSIYKDDSDKNLYNNSIKLMTIHKSKGLEFPNVAILQSKTLTFPEGHWMAEQEKNLKYVAITRAIETLCYMSLDNK